MHAAVVTSFDTPPRYEEASAPTTSDPDELVVRVVAAGLHPRVRSQSNGSHYTSTDELPLIPGVDGVARMPDGGLRYFVLPDTTQGSMAEQTVIDLRRSVALPDGVDPVQLAAAMNPAMSSWIALRKRTEFQRGQSVLVLGATGSAGQLAVQIAKHLGASSVIAAGRDQARLDALLTGPDGTPGADRVVSLVGTDDEVAERLGAVAADVDTVIDYVWGETTARAMAALVVNRTDPGKPLTWIQIGSVGGRTAEIPSAALRAARLQIVGSGQGSVSAREIVAELPALVAEIAAGGFALNTRAVPLSEVEAAWLAAPVGDERVVIVP